MGGRKTMLFLGRGSSSFEYFELLVVGVNQWAVVKKCEEQAENKRRIVFGGRERRSWKKLGHWFFWERCESFFDDFQNKQ